MSKDLFIVDVFGQLLLLRLLLLAVEEGRDLGLGETRNMVVFHLDACLKIGG